jgi:hypothetical protein
MANGKSRFVLLVLTIGLAACASDQPIADEPDPPGDDDEKKIAAGVVPKTPRGGQPAEPTKPAQAGMSGRAQPPLQTPESEQRVQDECVAGMCAPSRLPQQPDLPFLADMGDGWLRLMEMEWEVAAGAEGYRCKTFTIPEDVYATAFFPQAPKGIHHVTFDLMDTPELPDQVFVCGVGGRGERKLHPGGPGSKPAALPAGVAMPLRAGQQIYMNVHLFNPTETTLVGRSGMWIKTLPREKVEQESEIVLVGPRTLDIPIGRSTHTGSCVVRAEATVYGIAPHMHFMGRHARAMLTSGGNEVVVHDDAFDATQSMYYEVEPFHVKPGDELTAECTFENTTDKPLMWGDSALEEMCFISFSIFPSLPYGTGPCDWGL